MLRLVLGLHEARDPPTPDEVAALLLLKRPVGDEVEL
jgi:hypothetical protein